MELSDCALLILPSVLQEQYRAVTSATTLLNIPPPLIIGGLIHITGRTREIRPISYRDPAHYTSHLPIAG